MHYKFRFLVNGKLYDEPPEEFKILVIEMLLRLYEKYKDDPKIFPQKNEEQI